MYEHDDMNLPDGNGEIDTDDQDEDEVE